MSNLRKQICCLPLALGLAACDGAPPPGAEADIVPVVLHTVQEREEPEYLLLSGDVEAWRTSRVGFQVAGVVASADVREGDRVRAGQLLASLDTEQYELNAEMSAAQADRAEDEFSRAERVFEGGGISANELHQASTAVRVARAQEAMAAKQLADARLTAPFDGIVAQRDLELGELGGPGRPVFTLMQLNPIQIRVGVPESEIGAVATGQRARIPIPALDGKVFEGSVRQVGVAADPASRTYLVRVQVQNPDMELRPGMIAEVELETSRTTTGVSIPAQAVVRGPDGVLRVYVYRPGDERVYTRRVVVGRTRGTEIEINEGLAEGDQVVVGGQHRVREGARVTVPAEGSPTPEQS
ncbi:MAG: efflux RND transporter periplasmic adaptor subunit [Gemmatimonadota bacterium]